MPRALLISALFSAVALLGCSSANGDGVLEVQVDGPGRVYSASVDHDTLGIDCRSDGKTRRGACVKELALDNAYTLVADPAPGAAFDHWEIDGVRDSAASISVSRGESSTHHVRAVFQQ
jgi:hypothetical protein